MSETYDVLVIGSGTAGQTAAYALHAHKRRVGVVESSERPGGTCALSGCQAKKWFYEAAETVVRSRHLHGIGITDPARACWADLRDAKNRFTAQVPANTVEGFKQAGIDFIRGRARFVDRRTIAVGRRRISARFFVVATGAVPMSLPIDGAHRMIGSAEFMELDDLPGRIVFIGGGFISFEFAHFAARLGPENSDLTILEAAPRPLGPFDAEMVDLLTAATTQAGIHVHTDVAVAGLVETDDGLMVMLKDGRRFEADIVVNGAGRAPNIDDLDLTKADVETSRRGIRVDAQMTTTNPAVYAVGDCAATVQLARVADHEAFVAAANIQAALTQQEPEAVIDYRSVPALLFTCPQYGMVGLTEQALEEQGRTYRKSAAKELRWPTYRRVGLKSAAYKVLVDEKGCFLGAHVLSDNAGGLINTFHLAMVNRIPIEQLHHQSIMSPYPTRESDIIYMLKPLLD